MTSAIDGETMDLALSADAEKEIIVNNFDKIVQTVVNEAQFMILSGRTPKSVIKTRPGRGGGVFRYVPHGFIVAILNRAFGFDWDFETEPFGSGDPFKIMPEDNNMKRKMSILVNGRLTVRIRDPQDPSRVIAEITKTATGEKEEIKGMTWGSLVKSAESDALKKCASKLGVALDLYWPDADPEFIPQSPEEIAIAQAKEETSVLHAAGATPKEIRDAIQDKIGVDVPLVTINKWIRGS